MKILGIIAEYNPFHNGHSLHLQNAKQQSGCSLSVAVMSGNFTQRGEPAIFNKWQRAQIAINEGIDLVIELPTVFCLRSAQYFAKGGVELLERLNIINSLAFGAETNNLPLLNKVAAIPYHRTTASGDKNNSYSSANDTRINIQSKTEDDIADLFTPNNILAIEYLKALKTLNSSIEAILVQRQYVRHGSCNTNNAFASATHIRSLIEQNQLPETKPFISTECYNTIECLLSRPDTIPVNIEDFAAYIFYKLYIDKSCTIAKIAGVREGIENKLQQSAKNASSVKELLLKTKSKRYLYTRLQRILINLLLNITEVDSKKYEEHGPLYARVLAFNESGCKIIKKLKHYSKIPVITKTTQYINEKTYRSQTASLFNQMLSVDICSTDIYQLASSQKGFCTTGLDFLTTPIFKSSRS